MQYFEPKGVYVAAWHASVGKHMPNPVKIPFLIAEKHFLSYK